MASSTWPGNSTIVRNMMLALIKLRFSVGSWLRPEATLRRAYQLFCTPFASSRTRARAIGDFGARRSTMAFGNEQVAVYIWGDASREPYVLLSHGWSSHATRFSKWIEPLRAAGFAVVGFDQLGHGQSSGKRTNLPEFAQVLAAVAGRYGQASAVIGHSLGGGAVALMLAEARLAERAILIAPVADPMGAASRFSQLVGLAEKLAAACSMPTKPNIACPWPACRRIARSLPLHRRYWWCMTSRIAMCPGPMASATHVTGRTRACIPPPGLAIIESLTMPP
jgi:pimeloyl-ACP methyl ester carboxylesterase